jgi:phosphoenolpyruvate synthase/pyruvate phosphate dikinase
MNCPHASLGECRLSRRCQARAHFWCEGHWLCRTEHMFFEEERLPFVEKMILNAEEAQKLIDMVERMEGFLASGKLEGRALTDDSRKMVENELAEAKAA